MLNALDKVVWFICTARNAIVVIACLVIASVLDPDIEECMVERENCTFTLTGKIERGLITPTYSLLLFTLHIHSDLIHCDRHNRVRAANSSAASVWNRRLVGGKWD